jgi:DNA-binding response OmpR family regulator
MKILIAEDDAVSRLLLERTLIKEGHEVVVTEDGTKAWAILEKDESPQFAVLDWMMPGLDGVEICRLARQFKLHTYIILLTAKGCKEDIACGLDAGADDYVVKPFDRHELLARVRVGVRVAQLQKNLSERIGELEEALTQVKQLQGILPICSYCKKIRDDQNYWQRVESYISEHSEAQFSHSICPDCYDGVVKPQLEQLRGRSKTSV